MSISLYGLETGDFDTKRVISAGATVTEIVPAGNNLREVVCIVACNATAGALTWTAEVYDGATSFYLVNTEAIAARGRGTFELPIKFSAAETIRVTASGAGVHFACTFRKLPGKTP